jgi:hypothetical protein
MLETSIFMSDASEMEPACVSSNIHALSVKSFYLKHGCLLYYLMEYTSKY